MRQESLPSPGLIGNGQTLRALVAKVISQVEIDAGLRGSGKSSHAKPLSDFFAAGVTALATFLDAVVPTVASRQIFVLTGVANKVRIRHTEGLDPKFVPAPAAFVLASPAKVISKVEVDGPDVILTVTVPYTDADDTATVAYTQPGAASNLRDLAGNLVANYTAQPVVNPL